MREKIEIRENQKAVFRMLNGAEIAVMMENNALFVRGADGWKEIAINPDRASLPQPQERP